MRFSTPGGSPLNPQACVSTGWRPVSLRGTRSAKRLFRYNKEEIPGFMTGEL